MRETVRIFILQWNREGKKTQRICYSGRLLGQSICPQIIQISERFNSTHWLDEGFVRLKSWHSPLRITFSYWLVYSERNSSTSLSLSLSGFPASLHSCVNYVCINPTWCIKLFLWVQLKVFLTNSINMVIHSRPDALLYLSDWLTLSIPSRVSLQQYRHKFKTVVHHSKLN